MLNIKDIDEVKDNKLKELLVELRRSHVSRFPIDVVVGGDGLGLKFMDSRFPNQHWRYKDSGVPQSVAFVWRDRQDKNGEDVYKIYSRLIQNNRFNTYNDDYHTKETTDMRKLAKLMKENIKPFTALEISLRTLSVAQDKFNEWKDKPQHEYNHALTRMYSPDWLEIFKKLKDQGVTPVSDKHEAIYQNAIPAYEEYLERKNKFSERVHVFINPDHTVQVTRMLNDKETHLYDSLDSIPPDIRQQVAMLQISEVKAHVGNVGVKMSDTEFWVDTL